MTGFIIGLAAVLVGGVIAFFIIRRKRMMTDMGNAPDINAGDNFSKKQNVDARIGCSSPSHGFVTLLKKVYICAPLGGDVIGNINRAKEYARFAFECGTAPVVPHFYALILNDAEPAHRELGLRAGKTLLWFCDEVWVFGNILSSGMKDEIRLAKQLNIRIRYFDRKNKIFGGTLVYEKKKCF